MHTKQEKGVFLTMLKISSLTLIVVLVWTLPLQSQKVENHHRRLYDHLFKDYNTHIRPVKDHKDAVVVNISIGIDFINDLDEKQQTLHANFWIR